MTTVRVKDGVQPRLVTLVSGLANAAQRAEIPEVWITAGMDGTHSPNSLHYALRAIDVRTHNLTPAQVAKLLAELGTEFSGNADVIWEGRGTPNEHVHVEWDPA